MEMLKNFYLGIQHIWQGLSFLKAHKKLWAFAILPTVINVALFIIMLNVFSHYYADIYNWLQAFLGPIQIEAPEVWYLKIAAWFLMVINGLFQIIIWLLALLCMLIIFYVLGFIIAGPFNDMLSERVEQIITGVNPQDFSWKKLLSDLTRTLKAEILKAIFFLSIPLALLLVVFIPIVGSIIYPALTIGFGMFDLSFNYIDYPMARKTQPFSERLKFAKKHKIALIAFGTPILIPFANFLLMAPLVVGGTMLYLKLKENN